MNNKPMLTANAHCDGPCGIYDPSSARIAAEAALSMTKKILNLTASDSQADPGAYAAYLNSMSRYIAIKEEQAHLAKTELIKVSGDSMAPIIKDGDCLLIDRNAFHKNMPRLNDIVVACHPFMKEQLMVKSVARVEE